MELEDVENMTEMECPKAKTWLGSPPLGDAHLSRHHWPLFKIPLSELPSSARGSYADRESHADLQRRMAGGREGGCQSRGGAGNQGQKKITNRIWMKLQCQDIEGFRDKDF